MFDQKVIDLVMSITSVKSDFYKIDAIPNKKEKNARSSLKIGADQKIYVLIDFTIFGSAKDAFAICSSGIYWKNKSKEHYISYLDLIKSPIGTNSDGNLLIKSESITYDIIGLNATNNIDVVEFCNFIKKIVEIYREEYQIRVEGFDQKIVELLTSAKFPNFHNIFISEDKEKNARASLQIPAQDIIYGLVDNTIFGSAKNAFAICSSGIYCNQREVDFLSYPTLLQCRLRIINSDKHISRTLLVKSPSQSYEIILSMLGDDLVKFCELIRKIINIYANEHNINVEAELCIECGKERDFNGNYAGSDFSNSILKDKDKMVKAKLPGRLLEDYLCHECVMNLQKKSFFNEAEASMIKTKEKQYKNLNIPLEDLELEVRNYLRLDDKITDVVVEKIDNLIWFYVLGFAVLIRGSKDDFTVKAGPIDNSVLSGVDTALLTILFGPAVLAAKAAGMIYDNKKTEYLFKHLDERFRILNRAKPENAVQGNTDADIPKKIEALAKLHQDGFLTDEEFKNKKIELLSRL